MVSESYQQAGIPINWHAALLRAVRKPLVAEGLTNREFEGDLENGNTVRIVMTSDVAIANYDRNTPITATILPLADQSLVADQQKSFNFQVNDLDVKQVKPNFVEEQSSRAVYNLKRVQDAFIFSTMYAGVAAANYQGAYTVSPVDADAFELSSLAARILDDNETPEDMGVPGMDPEGGPDGGFRFLVVPPLFAEQLVNDPRKSSFGTTDNLRTYGERYIGRSVAGLEIFKSTNLPKGSDTTAGAGYTAVIAGWTKATAFASQIVKFETQRVQGNFADFHMGMSVYGGKVVYPPNLVTFDVRAA